MQVGAQELEKLEKKQPEQRRVRQQRECCYTELIEPLEHLADRMTNWPWPGKMCEVDTTKVVAVSVQP